MGCFFQLFTKLCRILPCNHIQRQIFVQPEKFLEDLNSEDTVYNNGNTKHTATVEVILRLYHHLMVDYEAVFGDYNILEVVLPLDRCLCKFRIHYSTLASQNQEDCLEPSLNLDAAQFPATRP
jgi:hypothetical protein